MASEATTFIGEDARRAFEVLREGGIAVLPMDVGYSLIGGSAAALKRIFDTKGRTPSKLNAMLGHDAIAREVLDLSPRGWDVYDVITGAYDLPLGAVGPCRLEHPLLQAMEPDALSMSTLDATVCMLVNAGPFHRALCDLSLAHGHPLFGSSANLSLHGTKFRVQDIEPEVLAIADVVIDHGLRKYHSYRASSTLLDMESFEVLRRGSCFDVIADLMQRHFGIALPCSD
jgi:tRNA A37 threonylcarbamoyladenosine synthetase subunit TsaC/SUA5/YrdC